MGWEQGTHTLAVGNAEAVTLPSGLGFLIRTMGSPPITSALGKSGIQLPGSHTPKEEHIAAPCPSSWAGSRVGCREGGAFGGGRRGSLSQSWSCLPQTAGEQPTMCLDFRSFGGGSLEPWGLTGPGGQAEGHTQDFLLHVLAGRPRAASSPRAAVSSSVRWGQHCWPGCLWGETGGRMGGCVASAHCHIPSAWLASNECLLNE